MLLFPFFTSRISAVERGPSRTCQLPFSATFCFWSGVDSFGLFANSFCSCRIPERLLLLLHFCIIPLSHTCCPIWHEAHPLIHEVRAWLLSLLFSTNVDDEEGQPAVFLPHSLCRQCFSICYKSTSSERRGELYIQIMLTFVHRIRITSGGRARGRGSLRFPTDRPPPRQSEQFVSVTQTSSLSSLPPTCGVLPQVVHRAALKGSSQVV